MVPIHYHRIDGDVYFDGTFCRRDSVAQAHALIPGSSRWPDVLLMCIPRISGRYIEQRHWGEVLGKGIEERYRGIFSEISLADSSESIQSVVTKNSSTTKLSYYASAR